MTPGEASLMAAISDYLSPSWDERDTYGEGAYHHHSAEVQRAIAALQGCGWDPAAVAEFTRLLGGGGSTSWGAPVAAFTPACLSCGATVDLDTVHRAATMGVAARVEHWCHDYAGCRKRRPGHLVATSAGAA